MAKLFQLNPAKSRAHVGAADGFEISGDRLGASHDLDDMRFMAALRAGPRKAANARHIHMPDMAYGKWFERAPNASHAAGASRLAMALFMILTMTKTEKATIRKSMMLLMNRP